MIVMRWVDGLACPYVECENCGELIEDARTANVEWGGPSSGPLTMPVEGEAVPFRIVHKDSCCSAPQPKEDKWTLWTPLRMWVGYLAGNSGVEPGDEWKEEHATTLRIGR